MEQNSIKVSKYKAHKVFKNMKQRCYNKNHPFYDSYGGRNITICDEWLNKDTSSINFHKWYYGQGYTDEDIKRLNLSLDRKNNDKGYNPTNCRLANKATQSRNTKLLYKSNKSGFRGVSFKKLKLYWVVSISINKIKTDLGRTMTRLEAAVLYNDYVTKHKLEHTINIIPKFKVFIMSVDSFLVIDKDNSVKDEVIRLNKLLKDEDKNFIKQLTDMKINYKDILYIENIRNNLLYLTTKLK